VLIPLTVAAGDRDAGCWALLKEPWGRRSGAGRRQPPHSAL